MELEYERRGSGEPLVLIHSLGTDHHVWSPVLDLLAEQRDVIAIDMPGFGGSDAFPDDREPTPRALAGEIAGFLTSRGVDRPHVAGNSLGGWVALELAAAGEARSVTAISPAGLWPRALGPRPSVARGAARAAAPFLAVVLATERGRQMALAGTMAHPERVPVADAVRLVRAYAAAPGYDAANAAMRSGRFTGLAEIPVPVTLVWPQRDRLIGRPSRLPAAVRNIEIPDAGHVPMWDQPDAVAAALLGGSSVEREAAA